MNERLEEAAAQCESAAAELELAAKHCRTAAGHFREGVVPRAAAHLWAARGHALAAQDQVDSQARSHAKHSVP